jgi:hypothetical protein
MQGMKSYGYSAMGKAKPKMTVKKTVKKAVKKKK